MNLHITQMPEMRVAAVRHVGSYNQIGRAFEQLGALAGPAGLFTRSGAKMIAVYYDDPQSTPAAQLRSDAGIVVGNDTPVPKGLDERRVPAGTYAKAEHIGPYEELPDVWARLKRDGVPASGHHIHPDAASYEIYLNTPMDTPKDKLHTELYLQLK
jgi:AraC family transcriptional regulator